VRYKAAHVSWTIAMRGNMLGSQPMRPHSFTYQGSNVSFHRALISNIETAASEKSHPIHGSHRFSSVACAWTETVLIDSSQLTGTVDEWPDAYQFANPTRQSVNWMSKA
jgi:hypothetical protein